LWLLEPMCSTAVTKFGGTHQYKFGPALQSSTAEAFVHYVYEFSTGAIVYTDIQGM
ncbi:hypothetical protein BS47DRAFT_1292642, partial [Hydnum rufescens UP504]